MLAQFRRLKTPSYSALRRFSTASSEGTGGERASKGVFWLKYVFGAVAVGSAYFILQAFMNRDSRKTKQSKPQEWRVMNRTSPQDRLSTVFYMDLKVEPVQEEPFRVLFGLYGYAQPHSAARLLELFNSKHPTHTFVGSSFDMALPGVLFKSGLPVPKEGEAGGEYRPTDVAEDEVSLTVPPFARHKEPAHKPVNTDRFLHRSAGVLTMLSSDGSSPEFFVTCNQHASLDEEVTDMAVAALEAQSEEDKAEGKNALAGAQIPVIVGHLIEGIEEFDELQRILARNQDEAQSLKVTIVGAGEIPLR